MTGKVIEGEVGENRNNLGLGKPSRVRFEMHLKFIVNEKASFTEPKLQGGLQNNSLES